jgi:hypothetical protein
MNCSIQAAGIRYRVASQVATFAPASISNPISALPIPSVPPVTITTLSLKNDISFFDTAKLGFHFLVS